MPFRWGIAEDTALCIEVTIIRPSKPLQWLEVAENLNRRFSTEAKECNLKGRGCRDRVKLLVRKYKQDDRRSLYNYVV